MEYIIADMFLDSLTKKANRIEKKCKALGLPFTFKIGEQTVLEWTNSDGFKVGCFAHKVEVEGNAKINGWTFVAKIDHEDAGNIISNALDQKCPASYRLANAYCEHCKTLRDRNETFVIVNEQGEYKQVGKNCLKLYTDGMDAEACAEYASFAHLLEETANRREGLAPSHYYATKKLVATCIKVVSKIGYVRDKVAEAVEKEYRFAKEEDPEYRKACEIIDEAKAYEGEEDYLLNVKVAVSSDYIDMKWTVLVASYIHYLRKQEAKKAIEESKAKTSNHVGNVGQRITLRIKRVKDSLYRTLYVKSTDYGTTTVVEMIDVDGNVIKWGATNLCWLRQADQDGYDEITVKATVKSHDEYKGIKQTTVQRVAVVEPKE